MHLEFFPSPVGGSTALIAWLLASAIACGDTTGASRHPYEGFTQPFRKILVAASDSGRVADVLVRRGGTVRRGQILLKLDTTILEAAREVAAAEAEASAAINALQVRLRVAQRRLEQFKALAESGRGSNEELLRAEADAEIARFNLKAAEEERGRQHLELRQIEAQIGARQAASPIDGVVTEVTREIGEFVSPNDPHVATVVDLSQLRTLFFLPTAQALRLQPKQQVRLTLPESNTPLVGVVECVGATTDADSGRVRVDVLIDNQAGDYRSGVRCVIDTKSFASSVPRRDFSLTPSRPR